MGLQAGWYPQDDGRERYWDGERWTDAFRGDLATEQIPAPSKREEGTWEQKGRLLLILLGVVAFVGLAATKCGGPSTSGPDEYNRSGHVQGVGQGRAQESQHGRLL